ncbi:MAG: HAMP domain-containing histidine kinase, partial [Actinomycetota bacterium]|nr:HAMP domain-containing histidine kinase [Actinomycetota bacterium]
MLDVVDRNTSRLKSLIDDLLTLSRIESGFFRMSSAPVDVAELVRGVAATVGPAVAEAGLVLDVDPGAAGVAVIGDGQQLERMLLNVVTNAVKFTQAGGSLRISAREDGDTGECVLVVSDTGIGIPESDQAQLFGRFFRATNATDRAIQGTGLGLTIVRGIAEQHGGSVELRSREGEGTVVTVRLPRRSDSGERGTPVPVPAFASPVPASGTLH